MSKTRISKNVSIAILSCLLCLIWVKAEAQKFGFTEKEDGVLLQENGQPVFYYQKETKSLNGTYPRANYLHPLYGLNGEVLTEDFPEDHLHHRGIFWAWHQLIVEEEKIGDPWECKGLEWDVVKVETKVAAENARLETWVNWKGNVNDQPKVVVKEKTIITTYSSAGGQRSIDFEIQLTANGNDVWLGGSEDAKGYSGFSARIKLPEDIAFSSFKGKIEPTEPAIEAGGWIDMTATFEKEKSGIVIMADTSLLKPFHGWILRNEKSMQNAAFPGREPVKIAAGETLSMRYRLLLHKDLVSDKEIQRQYNEFLSNR